MTVYFDPTSYATHKPFSSSRLANRLTELFTRLENAANSEDVLVTLQGVSEKLDLDLKRADTLAQLPAQIEIDQLTRSKRIKAIESNNQLIDEQKVYLNAQSEYANSLLDVFEAQSIHLDELIRDLDSWHSNTLEKSRKEEVEKFIEESANEIQKTLFDAERSFIFQDAGSNSMKIPAIRAQGNRMAERDIIRLGSFVCIVSGVLLLPFAPKIGSFFISSLLPGYKYASDKKVPFTAQKWLAHVGAGASTHVIISYIAAPIFSRLSHKIGGAAQAAGLYGSAKIVDIGFEVFNRALTQALMSAISVLVRKKILQEEIDQTDIWFAMIAGSCGASVAFGVEYAAPDINDALYRVGLKGVLSFVNQGVVVAGLNKLNKKPIIKDLFPSAFESAFWAIVYQTCDQIHDKLISDTEFKNTKSSAIQKAKDLKYPKKIINKLEQAKSLSELNDILNKYKLHKIIKDINGRKINQKRKDKLIKRAKEKELGVNDVLKEVYLDRYANADLPKDIKDRLENAIKNANNVDEINNAINEVLKDLIDKINIANNFEQAKNQIKLWIHDLVDRGYHPTGSHLPQKLLKDEGYIERLADRILKGEKIIWTHHHHRAEIEVNDNFLRRSGDNVNDIYNLPRKLDGNHDLNGLRANYNVIKNIQEELRKNVENKDPNVELQKILKDNAVKGLKPDKINEICLRVAKEIKLNADNPAAADVQKKEGPAKIHPAALKPVEFNSKPPASLKPIANQVIEPPALYAQQAVLMKQPLFRVQIAQQPLMAIHGIQPAPLPQLVQAVRNPRNLAVRIQLNLLNIRILNRLRNLPGPIRFGNIENPPLKQAPFGFNPPIPRNERLPAIHVDPQLIHAVQNAQSRLYKIQNNEKKKAVATKTIQNLKKQIEHLPKGKRGRARKVAKNNEIRVKENDLETLRR